MRKTFALIGAVVVWSSCSDDAGTVEPGASAVSITASSAGVMTSFGDARTVTAVVKDANQTVVASPSLIWSTSAPAVARIDGSGASATITAVGEGSAIVTASTGSVLDTVTVTVRQKVSSVELKVDNTELVIGESTQITATAHDARRNVISGLTQFTYRATHIGAVSVSPTGVVTALVPFGPAGLTASVTQDGTLYTGVLTIQTRVPPRFEFGAALFGFFERPTPIAGTGIGAVYFTIEGNRILYRIAWTELSGPATRAHLHGPASPSDTAPVLVDLQPPLLTTNEGSRVGSITSADIRPVGALPAISLDSLLVLLRTGKTYVNVHTTLNVLGEIRGQIENPFQTPAVTDIQHRQRRTLSANRE